jgi:hypothetical protein
MHAMIGYAKGLLQRTSRLKLTTLVGIQPWSIGGVMHAASEAAAGAAGAGKLCHVEH